MDHKPLLIKHRTSSELHNFTDVCTFILSTLACKKSKHHDFKCISNSFSWVNNLKVSVGVFYELSIFCKIIFDVKGFKTKLKKFQVPPVYGLDTTSVSDWDCNVYTPAIQIIESYINGISSSHEPLPLVDAKTFPNSGDETHFCEVCERVFVGQHQWTVHRKSKKHKRMQQHKKKEKCLDTNSLNC